MSPRPTAPLRDAGQVEEKGMGLPFPVTNLPFLNPGHGRLPQATLDTRPGAYQEVSLHEFHHHVDHDQHTQCQPRVSDTSKSDPLHNPINESSAPLIELPCVAQLVQNHIKRPGCDAT